MTTFLVNFTINRRHQMEHWHGRKQGTQEAAQKNGTHTLTGATRQRVGQRTSNYGGAQLTEPALGIADHLGITHRSARLSGNAGTMRPDVAEHTLNAPIGAERSWHSGPQRGRQLGANTAWAEAGASTRRTGRLVTRVGQTRGLNLWGGAHHVA